MPVDAPIERAIRWDVLIQQGSTFMRKMDLIGLTLDGVDFRGQIRRAHDSAEVLATYAFEVEGQNTLIVRLTDTQTSALPAGESALVHDIEMYTSAPAFVARILEGRVRVSPEVTR